MWFMKYTLVKPSLNPQRFLKNHTNYTPLSSLFKTQIHNSAIYPLNLQNPSKNVRVRRPLDVVFKEALGLCEKEQSLVLLDGDEGDIDQLKKNLRDLENEIRDFKASSSFNGVKVGSLKKSKGVSASKPGNFNAHFDSEVKEGGGDVGLGVLEGIESGNEGFSTPKPETLNGHGHFGSEVNENENVGKDCGNESVSSAKPETLNGIFGSEVKEGGSSVGVGELEAIESENEGFSTTKTETLTPLIDSEVNESNLSAKPETLNGLFGSEVKELESENEGVTSVKPNTLFSLFGRELKEGVRSVGVVGKKVVIKEISKDMEMLLRHLHNKGYFKNVNFMPGNRFDINCFYEVYAHEYVKSTLQRFGNEHKDSSKWVSGSDAKSVAVFGCPSVNKGDVFAAKKLRYFFNINEEVVCSKCVLKDSCKYANQSAGKVDNTTLRLDSLLRLLRAYSLEEIPPGLKLTSDVKFCVSRLIREVINLTKVDNEVVADQRGELATGR